MGALIRKGALIGRRALNRIVTVIQFYRTCIRPLTEYACPVFHDSLPKYLSEELERIQRRAMRIIFPFKPYQEALAQAGLETLSARR